MSINAVVEEPRPRVELQTASRITPWYFRIEEKPQKVSHLVSRVVGAESEGKVKEERVVEG